MSKNVLIISPRFPPTNAADLQRVRMALPYLEERGWVPTVVCVDPGCVTAPRDELLLSTVPAEIEVHRVKGFSGQWTRRFGVGSLAIRTYYQLAAAAEKLLETREFDLVFFSTTEFGFLPLGPKWLRRYGVPFVVDLQDPWVNDYYRQNRLRPPGGKLKHSIHQWFASKNEPHVLKHASGVMVVSDWYIESLCKKYSFLDRNCFVTIPFAATSVDFDVARSNLIANHHFQNNDGFKHWVYFGRCGVDMTHALSSILKAFAQYLQYVPDQARQIRFHFIGTDYASGGAERYWVKPIAESLGVGSFVHEQPCRIPFFETLRCLIDSDAVVVPGSSDSSYTASKIYPYIAAGRPLLSVFHKNSSVNQVMHDVGGRTCISFSSSDSIDATTREIYQRWFLERGYEAVPHDKPDSLAPYLAPVMTDKIVNCFEKAAACANLG